MTILKVAVLGNGNAAKKHVQAFERLPTKFQITPPQDADIVDICTPNYLHVKQTMLAMVEGKNVIVEKPIAGSLYEVDMLKAMQRVTGKSIYPISQYRFAGIEMNDNINRVYNRPASYYNGWRGDPDLALGGVLLSHTIHDIDLCVSIYGLPVSVLAELRNNKRNVETSALIELQYQFGTVTISTIISATIPNFNVLSGDTDHFVKQFDLIASDNPKTWISGARDVIEIITACYYSHLTKARVALPIVPEHPFYRGWRGINP